MGCFWEDTSKSAWSKGNQTLTLFHTEKRKVDTPTRTHRIFDLIDSKQFQSKEKEDAIENR